MRFTVHIIFVRCINGTHKRIIIHTRNDFPVIDLFIYRTLYEDELLNRISELVLNMIIKH